jgi:hypothetical protein
MQTHRAYQGADTAITAWVRDDAGKRDMTGETLTVHLFPYGSSTELSESAPIAAASSAEGRVTFTVSEAYTDSYTTPGPYRMQIKADGSTVLYDALLEVV